MHAPSTHIIASVERVPETPLSNCRAFGIACQRQPGKLLSTLGIVLMIAIPSGIGIIIPIILQTPIHPIWGSIIATVLYLQALTASCVYAEDSNHLIRAVRLNSFVASSFCTFGVIVCLSAKWSLWNQSPLPTFLWVVPIWMTIWICACPVMNSRSPDIRMDRVVTNRSIWYELVTCIFTGVFLTVIMGVIIGAVVAMQYISDPVLQVFVVSVMYPILKYVLKRSSALLQSRTGLDKDIGDFNGKVRQIMRLTVQIDLVFGMPGQCALALLPSWGAFGISIAVGILTQWLSDYALLYKQVKGTKTPPPTKVFVGGSQNDRNYVPLDHVRILHESRLESEDVADKIVVTLAAYVGASALSIANIFCKRDNRLCTINLPLMSVIIMRSLIMLFAEMFADVVKNGVFWSFFVILPARITYGVNRVDVVQIALAIGSTCNMVVAGTILYVML
jgi:hypothetical protein